MTGRTGHKEAAPPMKAGRWVVVLLLAGCSSVVPSAAPSVTPSAAVTPSPRPTPEYGLAAQHIIDATDRLAAGADPQEWFTAEARWLVDEPVVLPSDVLNLYRTIIMSGMAGDTGAARLVLEMRPIVARLLR